ncbi:alpha-ketoglutarate-dependent dioxygenase AlkB [Striga asiatica]|uniref:Alpha-ketoglutarate-dependent dioxygenase AlkB n=1 Tax=Striga asiatica TaxID=4170 RepID=A0A5A7Q0Y3_STRAF|nr:alpha-ketoglutarate-dependent dioxygenase AlkB [Striga asiatica]
MTVSRATCLAKTKTAWLLIDRNHSTSFRSVDGFQHFDNFVHFGPLVWACIPTSFHHICKRARAASRNFGPQVPSSKIKCHLHNYFESKLFSPVLNEVRLQGTSWKIFHNNTADVTWHAYLTVFGLNVKT